MRIYQFKMQIPPFDAAHSQTVRANIDSKLVFVLICISWAFSLCCLCQFVRCCAQLKLKYRFKNAIRMNMDSLWPQFRLYFNLSPLPLLVLQRESVWAMTIARLLDSDLSLQSSICIVSNCSQMHDIISITFNGFSHKFNVILFCFNFHTSRRGI